MSLTSLSSLESRSLSSSAFELLFREKVWTDGRGACEIYFPLQVSGPIRRRQRLTIQSIHTLTLFAGPRKERIHRGAAMVAVVAT